jgi:hypothetical protein
MNDSVSPSESGMAKRAAAATLNLERLIEKGRGDAENRAIITVRDRATASASILTALLARRSGLQDLGVATPTLASANRKAAADSRAALRAAATALTKLDTEVTNRLNGDGVQQALKGSESLRVAIEKLLVQALDNERRRLKPKQLDEPIPSVSGSISLATRLERLRNLLNAPMTTGDIADAEATIVKLREARSDWDEGRPSLDVAVQQLPKALRDFIAASNKPDGAPFSMLTAEVRAWLDDPRNGQGYRVRAW